MNNENDFKVWMINAGFRQKTINSYCKRLKHDIPEFLNTDNIFMNNNIKNLIEMRKQFQSDGEFRYVWNKYSTSRAALGRYIDYLEE